MPNYRRIFCPGAIYFFTLVTAHRRPMLTSDQAREILHAAFAATAAKYPFAIQAICLLPDHLHCIWTLPDGESDYAIRWQFIKARFSYQYLSTGKRPIPTASQSNRRESGLWQRRYWEHLIRDERDLQAHVDYIHFNPVKHGLVNSPDEWQWSSFHRFVREGFYPAGLETGDAVTGIEQAFGE